MIFIEGGYVNISCPLSTPKLTITYAYYGSYNCTRCNCTRMDFTQKIVAYCSSNGTLLSSTCSFAASNSFFIDTCNLVQKRLWLTYLCDS